MKEKALNEDNCSGYMTNPNIYRHFFPSACKSYVILNIYKENKPTLASR